MDFMKILLIYMTAVLSLSVQSTTAPVETPVPTPSAVQVQAGETPAATENVVITPEPEATPEPTEEPEASPIPKHTSNVLDLTLDDALIHLHNAGYESIYITFSTVAPAGSTANTVISQTDTVLNEDTGAKRSDLIIYRTSTGSYHADVSFTYSPSEENQENNIRIVYESTNYLDIPYRVVVFSTERPYESNDATIAATVNCYDPVTRQLILMINDVDIASQSVTFTK